MSVTILELALHRGASSDTDGGVDGAEFEKVGLQIMGGCQVCGATLAAYNGCPSKSGYWRCRSGCIGDDGYETVAEADAAIFGKEDDDDHAS
jgi:hypothetical protein